MFIFAVVVSIGFGIVWLAVPLHSGMGLNIFLSVREWSNDFVASMIAYVIPPIAVFIMVYLPFALNERNLTKVKATDEKVEPPSDS